MPLRNQACYNLAVRKLRGGGAATFALGGGVALDVSGAIELLEAALTAIAARSKRATGGGEEDEDEAAAPLRALRAARRMQMEEAARTVQSTPRPSPRLSPQRSSPQLSSSPLSSPQRSSPTAAMDAAMDHALRKAALRRAEAEAEARWAAAELHKAMGCRQQEDEDGVSLCETVE